jgi:8-oxo-dGTP diphosphatase
MTGPITKLQASAAACPHRPAPASPNRRPKLTEWAVSLLVGLLLVSMVILAWRRLAGGLVEPLLMPTLLAVGAAIVTIAAAVRIMQPSGHRSGRLLYTVVSISVVATGLALSLPATSPAALAALWLLLLAEEAFAWWPAGGRLKRPAPPAAKPVGDEVLQQLTRTRAADGTETISGVLRVPLEAGQRTANVHVAFCPPLGQAPRIEVQQRGGPEVRIKTGQLLPYGARLDLKLAEPLETSDAVVLEFSAQSPLASSATAAESAAQAKHQEAAVAVVGQGGCVLIGRRPPGAALAGMWEFPGGKIQPGESAAEAAIRECREESGLDVRVTSAFPAVTQRYEHALVRLHFFACQPLDAAQPPREPFRWVPVAELGQYSFPPANAGVLEVLGRS